MVAMQDEKSTTITCHQTLHIEQCGEKHLELVKQRVCSRHFVNGGLQYGLLNRTPSVIVESTVFDPGADAITSTANTPIGAEYTPTVDLGIPSALVNPGLPSIGTTGFRLPTTANVGSPYNDIEAPMIGANVGSTAVKASSHLLKPKYASHHMHTAVCEEFGGMQ